MTFPAFLEQLRDVTKANLVSAKNREARKVGLSKKDKFLRAWEMGKETWELLVDGAGGASAASTGSGGDKKAKPAIDMVRGDALTRCLGSYRYTITRPPLSLSCLGPGRARRCAVGSSRGKGLLPDGPGGRGLACGHREERSRR